MKTQREVIFYGSILALLFVALSYKRLAAQKERTQKIWPAGENLANHQFEPATSLALRVESIACRTKTRPEYILNCYR